MAKTDGGSTETQCQWLAPKTARLGVTPLQFFGTTDGPQLQMFAAADVIRMRSIGWGSGPASHGPNSTNQVYIVMVDNHFTCVEAANSLDLTHPEARFEGLKMLGPFGWLGIKAQIIQTAITVGFLWKQIIMNQHTDWVSVPLWKSNRATQLTFELLQEAGSNSSWVNSRRLG